MTDNKILASLRATGIPIEDERAVPSNGVSKQLPYMVIRKESHVDADDMGRVAVEEISWTVALFTINKDTRLEGKIRLALLGAAQVAVNSFPDGEPYQTNFEFRTRQALRKDE